MVGQAFEQRREEEKREKEEKTVEQRIYELGRKTTDPKETMSRIPQTKQVQEAIKTDTTIKAIESTARLSKSIYLTNVNIKEAVPNLLTAIEDIVPKKTR
ncbi:MAG: hypothetical protein ACPL06_00340 [Candidatus Anstonellales archaeon]